MKRLPLLLVAVAFSSGAVALGQGAASYDLVLAGGRVIDPGSGLDAVRHVGIAGGSVRAVSASPLQGRVTIDAAGLVVAPGFVDLHQHGHTPEDYQLKAADGVTTAFELEIGVNDIDAWYAARSGKSAINYGASVGHAAVRMKVMGDPGAFLPSGPAGTREATAAELEQIKTGVRRGLERGAVGVGLGIAYTPVATHTEILDVFAEAGRAGAPVFVHMRDGDAVAATHEVLALALATGTPLHVVHVQSTGRRQTADILRLIGMARHRGFDVTTEMYPYTAGSSKIESTRFDNWEQFPDERFQDFLWPATGERLTRELFAKYRKIGGPVVQFGNTEEVVSLAIAHPLTMVASDGGPAHPRGSGTYARVLGRYVREQKALTLVDALRKMTIMPARRLEKLIPAMQRRGRISVGADADITIFDPERVIDAATYEAPATASIGMRHVLVGGTFVVRDARLQAGAFPGQAIRGR